MVFLNYMHIRLLKTIVKIKTFLLIWLKNINKIDIK